LVLLEGAARVTEIWIPPLEMDYGLGFEPGSRLFIPSPEDPSVMITHPAKEKSFQKQRFNARKAPGTFRLFALGGSSINYLGKGLHGLDVRLQKALGHRFRRVETINAGGLSHGSQRLAPIAAEVVRYEPDLILLYCGHNEFEELDQLEFANLGTLIWQQRLSRSALFRFLRDRKAAWSVARLQREHNRAILANPNVDYTRVWQHRFTPGEVEDRMRAYRRNLSMIALMCRAHGVPLIVGTVPSNLVKPNVPPEYAGGFEPAKALFAEGRYQEGMARVRQILRTVPRHQSSDAENEIIRSVAAEFDLGIADVEAAVAAAEPHGVPGETLFKDECHLNRKGNNILIGTFEKAILRRLGTP
ncbi:MAG TPA: SGNH/GDSL hydrolase family protein, partial [Candidatus Hydrogenedentes bacterium]|nr:SGNH/GDSL hydrolase family protein [Candidatus Hydrogenedentota bacterium]